MHVLQARNVHVALPHALHLLDQIGVRRSSRNGDVLKPPFSVTTVYKNPLERVIFWPERDANPFFHLYESLWMLAGRQDVAPLLKYSKQIGTYANDGVIHGAYGYRWRNEFSHYSRRTGVKSDQLEVIASRLREKPEDRQCVLQMWDTRIDLDANFFDLPCNTMATFQRDEVGRLDLTVFCRSNDILWGCYGANAVHFSMLLEYMASWIGCPVGIYQQVSVNWHGYLNTLEQVKCIRPDRGNYVDNPYARAVGDQVHVVPMPEHEKTDSVIKVLLTAADQDMLHQMNPDLSTHSWGKMIFSVLKAHEVYRKTPKPDAFGAALDVLNQGDRRADWIVAAREWILRRELSWSKKNGL